jgi:hypothetical protein
VSRLAAIVALLALALALGSGCVTSHAVHLEPIHVEPIHVRMDVSVRMETADGSEDEADEVAEDEPTSPDAAQGG